VGKSAGGSVFGGERLCSAWGIQREGALNGGRTMVRPGAALARRVDRHRVRVSSCLGSRGVELLAANCGPGVIRVACTTIPDRADPGHTFPTYPSCAAASTSSSSPSSSATHAWKPPAATPGPAQKTAQERSRSSSRTNSPDQGRSADPNVRLTDVLHRRHSATRVRENRSHGSMRRREETSASRALIAARRGAPPADPTLDAQNALAGGE
jgi:hypothetical protein